MCSILLWSCSHNDKVIPNESVYSFHPSPTYCLIISMTIYVILLIIHDNHIANPSQGARVNFINSLVIMTCGACSTLALVLAGEMQAISN